MGSVKRHAHTLTKTEGTTCIKKCPEASQCVDFVKMKKMSAHVWSVDPRLNRDWQPQNKKKNFFSLTLLLRNVWRGNIILWLVSCGRRKQGSAVHMFHLGWGHIPKFHSCSPSLTGDPKYHKLNARIRQGPVGLYPPSGRLVITPWNRKVRPRRATQLSASINFSNL